jgi:tripartite-type tricarboxylate transporter receptor subunit TctC
MSAELFMAMTGAKMTHVQYRGSAPAMNDLLPGRVQLIFDNLPGSIEHIKAGSLRALGVTAANRSAALSDVPTIGETVPGYEVSVWNWNCSAQRDAIRNYRYAQRGGKRGIGGPEIESAFCGARRRANADDAR